MENLRWSAEKGVRATHDIDTPAPSRLERGAIYIWCLLMLPILLGMLGFAIDVGYMVWVGKQLQVAADASALAAAFKVRSSREEARAAAVNVAAANFAINEPVLLDPGTEEIPGDILFGRFDRSTGTFDTNPSAFNAVQVTARRTDTAPGGAVPLLFAPIFQFASTNISRTGIAMIGGGTEAGLIVLAGAGHCSLDLSGNVTLTVNGGAIQVNSGDLEAACFGGNVALLGDEVNIQGGYDTVGNPILPDQFNTGVEPIPDPLAHVPEPTWDPANDLGTINNSSGAVTTIGPGYYSGGISMLNGSLTLTPGIYILEGVGLNLRGGNFYADGVMLFIHGTGSVYIGGNGGVQISPPDPALYSYPGVEVYEGIAIFQARDNTNPGTIIGTSLMDLEGSYYFPNNHMSLGGDATKFGNQFVVSTLDVFGNGTLEINYDGRFPAQGSSIFLVR